MQVSTLQNTTVLSKEEENRFIALVQDFIKLESIVYRNIREFKKVTVTLAEARKHLFDGVDKNNNKIQLQQLPEGDFKINFCR